MPGAFLFVCRRLTPPEESIQQQRETFLSILLSLSRPSRRARLARESGARADYHTDISFSSAQRRHALLSFDPPVRFHATSVYRYAMKKNMAYIERQEKETRRK